MDSDRSNGGQATAFDHVVCCPVSSVHSLQVFADGDTGWCRVADVDTGSVGRSKCVMKGVWRLVFLRVRARERSGFYRAACEQACWD